MENRFGSVSIVGIGQIPVQKENPKSIREMGAEAVHLAMKHAGIDSIDALFVGNMIADELQGQKHMGTLVASAAGLRGIEALHVRAATATGAAALRMAYFKVVTDEVIRTSRVVISPMRLYDAAPVCDGAAAVVLSRSNEARAYTNQPVKILSSSVATDWLRINDRPDPLHLFAAARSAQDAFRKANVHRTDIDFFEVHDAFSIMSCLALEAIGFAEQGQGWRLAAENQIGLDGPLPISTFGGLKARGHPIGATALYQTCEIVQQLTGQAGENQVKDARLAMLLSIGGAASTALTHVFGV